MRTVVVTSIKGGAGTTTIVAHLGSALKRIGIPVVLIDLCPTNQLCLHMGMDWAEKSEHANESAERKNIDTLIKTNRDDIMYLPYGEGVAFKENSEWYKSLLADIDLPENCFVIFDCPSLSDTTNGAVAEIADQTLLVMTADPACYASFHSYSFPSGYARCLVNRFNPLMALEADIFDLLLADYPQRVLPFTIHRDESVREALAHKQTVFSHEKNSQAAHDYTTLAEWLINQDIGEVSHE